MRPVVLSDAETIAGEIVASVQFARNRSGLCNALVEVAPHGGHPGVTLRPTRPTTLADLRRIIDSGFAPSSCPLVAWARSRWDAMMREAEA